MGVTINWLVPFEFHLTAKGEGIDTTLISNFVEFYITMMGFVNYKLYASQGLVYPPNMINELDALGDELAFSLKKVKVNNPANAQAAQDQADKSEKVKQALLLAQRSMANTVATEADKKLISSLSSKIAKISTDADEKGDADVSVKEEEDKAEVPKEIEETAEDGKTEKDDVYSETNAKRPPLFRGLVFWINREVPLFHIGFMIRAFEGKVVYSGCKMEENDESITHQVVDREVPKNQRIGSREYIQPQWVFDSINAGILLPVHEYGPDVKLPPHLSPFVNEEEEEGYVPDQQKHIQSLIERETKKWDTEEGDEEEGEGGEEEEEEEEGGIDDDDDEVDPQKGMSLEQRYMEDLKKERSGLTFSQVNAEQEEKKRVNREEKEAKEARDKRIHELANIPYERPLTKKQRKMEKKNKPKAQQGGLKMSSEQKQLLVNTMGRRKQKLLKKNRREAKGEERVNISLGKEEQAK